MAEEKRPRIRVAALIRRDDEVLLVRHEKDGRSYWLLPGGGVDFGESLHEALQREMMEEVGISIDPGPLALVHETIAPDGSRHVVHVVFRAAITEGVPKLGTDPRVVEVAYQPVARIEELSFHPPAQALIKACLEGQSALVYGGTLWQP